MSAFHRFRAQYHGFYVGFGRIGEGLSISNFLNRRLAKIGDFELNLMRYNRNFDVQSLLHRADTMDLNQVNEVSRSN